MPPFDLKAITAELSGGYGDAHTVRALGDGQLVKRMHQLQHLLAAAAGHPDAEAAGLPAAVELLSRMQAADPEGVRHLLSLPATGSWLHLALHRMVNSPREGVGDALRQDLGYPGWLVAAALLRSRTSGEVTVVVREGCVMLPGLGLIRLAACGYGLARLETTADGRLTALFDGRETEVDTTVTTRTAGDAVWTPVARLTALRDPALVVLDDLDPFRTLDTTALPTALEAERAAAWRESFRTGWRTLHEDHAEYAGPLAAGLRSVIPLSAEPGSVVQSSAAPEAYGSVRISLPRGPYTLASLLVHEFQHAKLSALLDYVDLTDPDAAEERYYAPWRNDPRPAAGLLHGVYAHVGVTNFWRVHRGHGGSNRNLAEAEFVRWRIQVRQAMDELYASDTLTATGREVVAALERTLAPWLDEPVADETLRVARQTALAHRVAWRVRNLAADAEHVEEIVRCRLRGAPAPRLRPSAGDFRPAARNADRWRDDGLLPGFLRLMGTGGVHESAGSADLALAAQDYQAAVGLYDAEIAKSPTTATLWAGMAVALTATRGERRTGPVTDAIETVAAVYLRLAEEAAGGPVSVTALVDWLGPTDR